MTDMQKMIEERMKKFEKHLFSILIIGINLQRRRKVRGHSTSWRWNAYDDAMSGGGGNLL
jgi:hypothetical protein